jgi:hypothetical protein
MLWYGTVIFCVLECLMLKVLKTGLQIPPETLGIEKSVPLAFLVILEMKTKLIPKIVSPTRLNDKT